MKRLFFVALLFIGLSSLNAQSLLRNIGQRARNSATTSVEMKADRAIHNGIDGVLSGRAFRNKSTSKGTDEALVSYINSDFGFKGKYPRSYTRKDADGAVEFSSSNGVSVTFDGYPAETSIEEEFKATCDQIAGEFELLESSQSSDEFTIKYNTGGTFVSARVIHRDDRAACVMVAYPEDEAKAYKKLVANILSELTFIR